MPMHIHATINELTSASKLGAVNIVLGTADKITAEEAREKADVAVQAT